MNTIELLLREKDYIFDRLGQAELVVPLACVPAGWKSMVSKACAKLSRILFRMSIHPTRDAEYEQLERSAREAMRVARAHYVAGPCVVLIEYTGHRRKENPPYQYGWVRARTAEQIDVMPEPKHVGGDTKHSGLTFNKRTGRASGDTSQKWQLHESDRRIFAQALEDEAAFREKEMSHA